MLLEFRVIPEVEDGFLDRFRTIELMIYGSFMAHGAVGVDVNRMLDGTIRLLPFFTSLVNQYNSNMMNKTYLQDQKAIPSCYLQGLRCGL